MTKERKFQRSPVDELSHITQVACVNSSALQELYMSRDYAEVERYYRAIKACFQTLDTQMTQICPEMELTEWANRMRLIQPRLDTLERNMPHKNTRLFDWPAVIAGMGLLEAFKVGAQQTVGLNEHLLKKTENSFECKQDHEFEV